MSPGEVREEEEEFASRVTLQGSVQNTPVWLMVSAPALLLSPAPLLAMAGGQPGGIFQGETPRWGWDRPRLPRGAGRHLKNLCGWNMSILFNGRRVPVETKQKSNTPLAVLTIIVIKCVFIKRDF